MIENRVVELFGIKYPIIQAGMIWCSGWKLASAVSNSGGLGIIGSGSMYPDVLKKHIINCKKATNFPFCGESSIIISKYKRTYKYNN